MENNEAVKALECFIGDTSCKGNCPFNDTPECFECTATPKKFYKSILEIINRQKAEIERLKNLESLEKAIYNIAHGIGTNHPCDFATKEARDISYEYAINKLIDIATARKEAIKEFSERLKNRHHTFKTVDDIFVQCIPLDYIDRLVKEMEADYESKGNN